MSDNEQQTTSTDRAVQECDEMIRAHRKSLSQIIVIGASLLSLVVFVGFSLLFGPNGSAQKSSSAIPISATSEQISATSDHKPATTKQKSTASDKPPATSVEIPVLSAQLSNSVLWGVFAIFVIIFSVVMSIYRFHLNEISKAEHYKLGFMRIRIAASNSKPTYQSEVRISLTDHAFAYEKPSHGLFKNKHIESPLPGHPTSDLATHLLDKMLDKFELVERKKSADKPPLQ
ncbi:MAG: hypothetical protein PHH36_03525 [Sideroxydans sp.]|nr:hypothetical protein [Sideroxydans sp.]